MRPFSIPHHETDSQKNLTKEGAEPNLNYSEKGGRNDNLGNGNPYTGAFSGRKLSTLPTGRSVPQGPKEYGLRFFLWMQS